MRASLFFFLLTTNALACKMSEEHHLRAMKAAALATIKSDPQLSKMKVHHVVPKGKSCVIHLTGDKTCKTVDVSVSDPDSACSMHAKIEKVSDC